MRLFLRREDLCKKSASVANRLAPEKLSPGETTQENESPMKMTTLRKAILQVAIFALGLTVLSALPAMAQDPSAPPPPPPGQGGPRHGGLRGNQVDFLTKQLNLTPDQVTQVKAIDEDTWKQMKALREDTSVAGPDKRAKMMDIHKASQDKIRGVLTADQQTKFDALQAQMRERRERHGGPAGPPPPPPPPQL
jgi:Spy/CpxP family protein refolding chaperone